MEFRRYVEQGNRGVEAIAADIQAVGATYRRIEAVDPWSDEGTFMYRWRTIDAGTTTPLLLWLFSQPEERLCSRSRLRCLRALESFLVRRMVARYTTKDCNKFFLEVLKRLEDNGPEGAEDAMVAYLAEQTSETRMWPPDDAFRSALLHLPLYRLLTRARLRFILEALEDHHRGPKTEDEHVVRGRLTIEHILPQAWRRNWALPHVEDPTRAEIERDGLVHTIGNLTLVTSSLNPALSNDPWDKKQQMLGEHTVLLLNKRILDLWPHRWTEGEIRERGSLLADDAIAIWPAGRALTRVSIPD